MRTPLFAANWKMHQSLKEAEAYARQLREGLERIPGELGRDYEVWIAPQAVHLLPMARWLEGSGVAVVAQNCGPDAKGAFTGELSPAQLVEVGCRKVILGHSERRHVFGEQDSLIARRMKAAWAAGLQVILCVGETLEERRSDRTFQVVESQLSVLDKETSRWDDLVIAYEPVWAIGTGENATPDQAQEVQARIRQWLGGRVSEAVAERLRILYGGSAKADNAESLMAQPDVDGLLVGSASLDAGKFADLIQNGLRFRP